MLSHAIIASAVLQLIISSPLAQSDSGAKKRLGQIVVNNAVVFTPDQIKHIAGIKPGKLIDDQQIEKAVERIRKAYLQRGFIEVKASINNDRAAHHASKEDQIFDLQITILEGPRFYIRRTEVVGNQTTNHNVVMRAAGGLRPNQPYNPEHVEKWVSGLNRLGRFELVKREDIEINIDEQGHFVDLLFHLKEKPGLSILRN